MRRRRRVNYRRRRARRRLRRFRRGLRSRYKFIRVFDVNADLPYFEVAAKVADFDQAKAMLGLRKRYRIKGMNLRYRSDIRGAMANWKELGNACVRLGGSPIAYEGEFTDCNETNCLRIRGFYREFVLQRDFAVNRKTLVVNRAASNPSRNPWLADPNIPHYGLFLKGCNMILEFSQKVKRTGKIYVTIYIQFRYRKLASR
ncbi:hypothetical protein AHF37_12602 [Paragonimus kellicotti]|nr:hypothetical protein AHF37_12602 [Paragonimus kellicotti]